MKSKEIIQYITNWMIDYIEKSKMKGFIIGVSGGIDSAVVSTLIAKTKKKVLILEMPIHQQNEQVIQSSNHIIWLKKQFKNVKSIKIDLTSSFDQLKNQFLNFNKKKEKLIQLSLANLRARLRMLTLYYYAGINEYLVVGTGNKIEDFELGFFTKYGDGGVDLLPIADLLKSQIYKMAENLNIIESIKKAKPTDGLWDDNRTDEDQIGASYDELEWVINYKNKKNKIKTNLRQKKIIKIYNKIHQNIKHKINPIPICKIPKKFL